MTTVTNREQHYVPSWRRGIFPLVMLTVLCGVGFLVQLPVAVESHVVAAETGDRQRAQEAQHTMTVAMALGASALLTATMLRDHIKRRAEYSRPTMQRGPARKAKPQLRGHSHRPVQQAGQTFRRTVSRPPTRSENNAAPE